MRGKHLGADRFNQRGRIIPAHAGQTSWLPSGCAGYTDHPRACGANAPAGTTAQTPTGSSPRMRGKQAGPSISRRPRRIIPAHAGQTTRQTTSFISDSDHPRACGANDSEPWGLPDVHGSSPRMRGKLGGAGAFIVKKRIIPAHAGQTRWHAPTRPISPDHPRACGANPWVITSPPWAVGSSPRMRGKQSDFMRKLLSAGPSIIGFAQWLQSSYYCSCLQSSAKTPISRGTTPTSLFLGFQNSITLLLLT